MRVLAIGDPHGDLAKIKQIPLSDVDLILLTGDLGNANLMRKMAFQNIQRQKEGLAMKDFSSTQKKKAFMEAYNSSIKVVRYLARFAPVYTIYGNVESSNKETRKYSKEIGLSLPRLTDDLHKIKGVRVINDTLITFRGVRIGGLQYFVDTNWVIDFKPRDYRKRMSEAKKETLHAQKVLRRFGRVDILVHHQPPYGLLDKVTFSGAPAQWKGKHAGSKVILKYIQKSKPLYAFCGHIHEGEGMKQIGPTRIYNLGVAGHTVIEI